MNSEAMRAALELAIRQNEHDMLMTGEELRKCKAALSQQPAQPSCEPMAWYLPDVKMVTTSEVERDRWLSEGHIVISLYPI